MYVLGIDGGGTKTHCLISELSGNILGFGKSGSGSYETFGLESAKKEILKAVNQALKQAKLKPEEILLSYFGLAGADRVEHFLMLSEMLSELKLGKKFILKNDSLVALRAGTKKNYGVVIISGTGTVVVGRNKKGEETRVGGLGPRFGDWGCGPDIARSGIISAIKYYEGRGEKTKLEEAILKTFNFKDVEELIDKMYKEEIDKKEITIFTKIVFQAAKDGDRVARKILISAGEELGNSACALIKKLRMKKENFELILAGSVFKGKCPILIETIKKKVKKIAPHLKLKLLFFPPVVGAIILALEELNIKVNNKIYKNIKNSLPKL